MLDMLQSVLVLIAELVRRLLHKVVHVVDAAKVGGADLRVHSV